jgi:hypothetical protein
MAASTKKITGLNKSTDVTLKRGVVNASAVDDASMKKLPGKKKPPTLTLKRGKNQSMEAAAPLRGKKK